MTTLVLRLVIEALTEEKCYWKINIYIWDEIIILKKNVKK